MKPDVVLTNEFIEVIPTELEDRKIYVSIEFATAIHKCCCGCGNRVVTPLSPNAWQLTFDGDTITLYPSIGNWNFACRSHYWVRKNVAVWVDDLGKSAGGSLRGGADQSRKGKRNLTKKSLLKFLLGRR